MTIKRFRQTDKVGRAPAAELCYQLAGVGVDDPKLEAR